MITPPRPRIAVLRPYTTHLRALVFETLEALGAELFTAVDAGVPDRETLRGLQSLRADGLLIPFHAHRDREGETVDGLSLLEKVRNEVPAHHETPVLCPVSQVGQAAVELLTSRLDAARLRSVSFLPERELRTSVGRAKISAFLRLCARG